MEKYIGTKLINATPMTRLAYNQFRGWELPADENGDDEGFLVEYLDGGKANTDVFAGYVSWSPKNVFERAYKPLTSTFDFGEAVRRLKAGKLVARSGWNGKNMFLLLVPGSTFKVNRAPLLGIFPEGTEINYRPHIDLKGVDGSISTWNPTSNDALAEDWVEAQAEVGKCYASDDIEKYHQTRNSMNMVDNYTVFFKDGSHIELNGSFMTEHAMLKAALAKVNGKS